MVDSNLDRLAAQTACEEKVDETIKSRDNVDIALARAELAYLLMKDRSMAVRDRLKRTSFEATNMTAEFRVEEISNASYRYVTCVILPDNRIVTTNWSIC